MPKMWIDKRYTDLLPGGDPCVEITIPDNCPHCNLKIEISTTFSGGPNRSSYLLNTCLRTGTFQELWKMRKDSQNPCVEILKDDKKIIDYASIYSCHRCKMVNEYATPNQPDGKYICYNCR